MKRLILHLLKKPLIRYLIIGGTSFATEYLSFLLLLVVFNLPVIVANAASFCLGLSVSFVLNRLWTFGGKEYHKRVAHQLAYYVTLSLINLFLTVVLVAYFKYLGIDPKIGKLMAMVITSAWNFILFKLIIFKHKPLDQL